MIGLFLGYISFMDDAWVMVMDLDRLILGFVTGGFILIAYKNVAVHGL
jgi:hypothetical protein